MLKILCVCVYVYFLFYFFFFFLKSSEMKFHILSLTYYHSLNANIHQDILKH